GHLPGLNADGGSCCQENGAELVLVGVPDQSDHAGTRQRGAMKDVHGGRSRAVGTYRVAPLDGFLNQVTRDARGLSAGECSGLGELHMTNGGEWTDGRIDDRTGRRVAISPCGIRYGALVCLRELCGSDNCR